MKLISTTDFVLEHNNAYGEIAALQEIKMYANFLKKTLNLAMFLPCNDEGKILEKPKREDFLVNGICKTDDFTKEIKKFELAQNKCLFKDFEVYTTLWEDTISFRNKNDCNLFIDDEGKFYDEECGVIELEKIEDLIHFHIFLAVSF